jgi:LmbE family N-acetylglucosaminyl deacetylase
MKAITSSAAVAKLGTIMGIWAHPDDESFTMAGLMAAAVQNGQTVTCVTATRGEAGSQDEQKWSPSTLGEVRAAELKHALAIIGVPYHYWLDYPDGGCHLIEDGEAIGRLLPIIDRHQPDTIITFPPDGITGHLDHVAVCGWATAAFRQRKGKPVSLYYGVDTQEHYDRYMRDIDEQCNVYFNVEQPHLVAAADCDIVLDLPEDLARIKHQVLEAMPSQTGFMFRTFGKEHMQKALSTEVFIRSEKEQAWAVPKPAKR